MNVRELGGLTVSFDDEGFMTNPHEWRPDIAERLALEEGIAPLTQRHWTVIDFVRREWTETGEAPTLRRITKRSGVPTKELYALFPNGPAKKVARLAGLGKPKGCL